MSVKTDPDDEENKEVSTVFGRCRCCLEYGYMKGMWEEHKTTGETEIYGEMLMETFSIAWDSANDSKAHICDQCIVRLRDACNFKKEVLASEQLLHDDSDKEYEMEDAEDDDWRMYKEDSEEEEQDTEEDDQLKDEMTELKSEPVEYEDVEYLEEYAMEVKGATKKPEPEATQPKTKNQRRKKPFITRPYKNYSASDMRNALEAVREGNASISEASKQFNVPRKTIAAKLHSLKNKPLGEPDAIKKRAREALKHKLYKYLGGDEVHKHKDNIEAILKWSNATPIIGLTKTGYQCYFCKKTFKLASLLKAHTTSTHKLGLAKFHLKHTLQWTVRLDITSLQCSLCDDKLTKIEDLIEHLRTHDKVVHVDIKNQIIPYSFTNNKLTCMVCDKTFKLFKPLTDHMIQHYKIYECNECGKGFVSKKNLSRHISRHKMGDFRCSYCGKEFSNRELVMNHERLMHKRSDGRKSSGAVECCICQKMLATSKQLEKHVKQIHLKESRYYCSFCDKGFYLEWEMRDHQLVHTRERRHECSLCPRVYTRRKALVCHLRAHAGERGAGRDALRIDADMD